ncbi:MAG: hypothetical protein K8S98_17865 [Planctomycetes bacterium]|nr:hypothetical protein [Planctomycetota bacterium]
MITLRFVDEHGAALGNVVVGWISADVREVELRDATSSDAAGRASLRAPSDGKSAAGTQRTLEAAHAGFASARRAVTLPARGALDLGDWMLVRSGRVAGWIRGADGAPIEGAIVSEFESLGSWFDSGERTAASLAANRATSAFSRSGPDGAFSLELPAGVRQILATHAEWTSTITAPLEVEADRTRAGVVLTLAERADPRGIRGLVLQPGGEPAAGARVRVTTSGSTRWLRADDAGRFHAAVPKSEPAEVLALDPQGRFGEARATDVAAGTADLLLRLTELAHVELCARESNGAALDRFDVYVEDESGLVELARNVDRERPGGCTSVSVPNQRFVIEVYADGYAPARLGPFDPKPLPARLECTLELGVGLVGTVRVGDAAAPHAKVSLHAAYDPLGNRFDFLLRSEAEASWVAEADEHGRYFLPIGRSGHFYVRAELEGFAPADVGPLECTRDRTLEQEVRLERGGAIEVRLRSSAGARVAGRVVAVSRGDGFLETRRIDADGLAVFALRTPGRWEARSLADELPADQAIVYFPKSSTHEVPWNCTVRSGETTRVDLWLEGPPSPFELAGTLLVRGAPAVGWSAAWTDEESQDAGVRTDDAGRFTLPSSRGGRRELRVVSPPGVECAPMLVRASVALERARTEWRLAIETGSLHGTIGRGPPATLVLHRARIGDALVIAPLAEASETTFERCVAAGAGEIVRVQTARTLEEQTPEILRTVELEPGGSIEIDLH